MVRRRALGRPSSLSHARAGAMRPRGSVVYDVEDRVRSVNAQRDSFALVVDAKVKEINTRNQCCGATAEGRAKLSAELEQAKKFEAACVAKYGKAYGATEACHVRVAELERQLKLTCTDEMIAKYPCVGMSNSEKTQMSVNQEFIQWRVDWNAYISDEEGFGLAHYNNIDDYEKRLDVIRQAWVAAGGAPPAVTPPKPKADEPGLIDKLGDKIGDAATAVGNNAGTVGIVAGVVVLGTLFFFFRRS